MCNHRLFLSSIIKSSFAVLAALFLTLPGTGVLADEVFRLADAARDRDMESMKLLLDSRADVNVPGSDGTPALHWMVRYGNRDMTSALLDAGADPELANRYGVTPLQLAAQNGDAAMLELLLEAGADPNATGHTGEPVLFPAVRSGSEAAVRLLLDSGASVDAKDDFFEQTALMLAVRENNTAIVQMLIARGADVNAFIKQGEEPDFRPPGAGGGSHGVGIVRGGWPEQGMRNPIPGKLSPLLYAARDGRLTAARMLVEAGADVNAPNANGTSPLVMAVMNNNIEIAHLLIEHGADIDAADWYGQTPLWSAVDVRNMAVNSNTLENGVDRGPVLELIRELLARGADPNPRTRQVPPLRRWNMPLGSLSWVDFTGQTPFLRAALSGDVTVMKLLHEYGADPHIATFGGTTPLMAAAGVNWVVRQTFDEGPEALLEAVKYCVELGMDVNAVNSMGLTALHGAANRGSNDIIEFLYKRGADPHMADNEGRTAMDWAKGVFLATHAAVPKPETIALLKRLGME